MATAKNGLRTDDIILILDSDDEVVGANTIKHDDCDQYVEEDLITIGRSTWKSKWRFPQTHRCPMCRNRRLFPTRAVAIEHFKKHHSESAVMCSLCVQPLSNKHSLKSHWLTFHQNEPLPSIFRERNDGNIDAVPSTSGTSLNTHTGKYSGTLEKPIHCRRFPICKKMCFYKACDHNFANANRSSQSSQLYVRACETSSDVEVESDIEYTSSKHYSEVHQRPEKSCQYSHCVCNTGIRQISQVKQHWLNLKNKDYVRSPQCKKYYCNQNGLKQDWPYAHWNVHHPLSLKTVCTGADHGRNKTISFSDTESDNHFEASTSRQNLKQTIVEPKKSAQKKKTQSNASTTNGSQNAESRRSSNRQIKQMSYAESEASFHETFKEKQRTTNRRRKKPQSAIPLFASFFVCPICKQKFPCRTSVKKHYQDVHTQLKQQCVRCGQRFSFKRTLDQHMKSKHKEVTQKNWQRRINTKEPIRKPQMTFTGISETNTKNAADDETASREEIIRSNQLPRCSSTLHRLSAETLQLKPHNTINVVNTAQTIQPSQRSIESDNISSSRLNTNLFLNAPLDLTITRPLDLSIGSAGIAANDSQFTATRVKQEAQPVLLKQEISGGSIDDDYIIIID